MNQPILYWKFDSKNMDINDIIIENSIQSYLSWTHVALKLQLLMPLID